MISLTQLLTEDKKVKIYVQKGKKPPKGKSLKKGPRGGQYFVGSPSEKKSYEGGKTSKASKPVAKPKVNIFDKPKKKVAPKKKPATNLKNYNGGAPEDFIDYMETEAELKASTSFDWKEEDEAASWMYKYTAKNYHIYQLDTGGDDITMFATAKPLDKKEIGRAHV